MKRILLLVLISLSQFSTSFADEYVLVMSKDDNVCQHMLKLYNGDMEKYGELRYSEHKEFNTIKWEKRDYLWVSMFDGKGKRGEPLLISRFDINNDGKPEIIIKDEHLTLQGPDSDVLYVFRKGDLDYSQEGFLIDDLSDKAIAILGFSGSSFVANVYMLYALPPFESLTIPGTKEPLKVYYSLGGWFYFNPFLYGNKYFVSMNGRTAEGWQVVLYLTPENQLRDTCYFIKVCGHGDKQKGAAEAEDTKAGKKRDTIPGAKDLVSGTYELIETPVEYRLGGLDVVQVSKDKIKFSLNCGVGPPSYNQASASGFATYKNNKAFYKDGDCEITFSFKNNTVHVEEKSTRGCMFYGNNVSCGGVYKLKSRELPNLDGNK